MASSGPILRCALSAQPGRGMHGTAMRLAFAAAHPLLVAYTIPYDSAGLLLLRDYIPDDRVGRFHCELDWR